MATRNILPEETHLGRIAIKPHLLRYIQWREQFRQEDQPLIVPGLGPIAHVLGMMLVTDREYLNAAPLTTVEGYTATLHYKVVQRHTLEQRYYLTDEGTREFNRFLQQMLQDDLFFRVREGQRKKQQEKDIIEAFLHDTGLDEWLEFDTQKKANFRLKQFRTGQQVQGYVFAF